MTIKIQRDVTQSSVVRRTQELLGFLFVGSHESDLTATPKHPAAAAKARKKKEAGQRIRAYYKRLLQVSEWMVLIPSNIHEFYIAPRADGTKSLVIFQGHRVEVRDKSGRVQVQGQVQTKSYDGIILEAFLSQENKTLVISDLIVWKHEPMTNNEFEFRHAWILSNLKANLFSGLKDISTFIT